MMKLCLVPIPELLGLAEARPIQRLIVVWACLAIKQQAIYCSALRTRAFCCTLRFFIMPRSRKSTSARHSDCKPSISHSAGPASSSSAHWRPPRQCPIAQQTELQRSFNRFGASARAANSINSQYEARELAWLLQYMPHSCRSNDLRKSCRAFCVSGCSDYNIIDKPFHAAQSADILFDSPKSTSCPLWPSRSRYRRLSFCPVRSKSRTRPSRWSGLARQNAPSFRPNPHSSRGGLSSPHLARQSLWTRTPNHRRKRRRRTAERSTGRSVASCCRSREGESAISNKGQRKHHTMFFMCAHI